MKWPWKRDKRLDTAEQMNAEVKRKIREQEPILRSIRKHDRVNNFGARLHQALNGDQR